MATRHQVRCINKDDRYDPHERIRFIGGTNANRSNWKLSQEKAIEGILEGKWSFFVSSYGQEVGVIVATSRYGNHYLKTEDDDYEPNNLLSLMECVS